MHLRLLLGGALALLALSCGPDTGAKNPSQADEQDQKARRLIEQGEAAARAGRFDDARKLIDEAAREAVNLQTQSDARIARERASKAEAKKFAPGIAASATEGRCQEALEDGAVLAGKDPELASFALPMLKKPIEACVDALLAEGKLEEVQKLLALPDAEKTLAPADRKALGKKLRKAQADALENAVREPVEAGRWNDALLAGAELKKKGVVPADLYDKLVEQVREGIANEIAKLHGEAVGTPKEGQSQLRRVDELLKMGWPPAADGATAAEAPQAARDQRQELAFWVACEALGCKLEQPAKLWTYGHAEVRPVADAKAAPIETIKTGKPVWRLASAKGIVLVASKDPGALEGPGPRARVALGWVAEGRLRSDDTSEMLPPDDSLPGTRVWGPLREAVSELELGTVLRVERGQVVVRRMSDRQEVKIARAKLHFGLTKKGTKVLGYCSNLTKLEPALIEEVRELPETKFELQADPVVVLACLNEQGQPTGTTKEGQLTSVRIKEEWLP